MLQHQCGLSEAPENVEIISKSLQKIMFNGFVNWWRTCIICGALRNLVTFLQFKKSRKTTMEEASACNFTKSNIPACVIFTVFKLHWQYQIAQSVSHFLYRFLHKQKSSSFLFSRGLKVSIWQPNLHSYLHSPSTHKKMCVF